MYMYVPIYVCKFDIWVRIELGIVCVNKNSQ